MMHFYYSESARSTVAVKPWALHKARELAATRRVPVIKLVTDMIDQAYDNHTKSVFR